MTYTNDKPYGVRLKESLKDAGISVQQLSDLLGVQRAAIYQWFSGATHPTGHNRDMIEKLLSKEHDTDHNEHNMIIIPEYDISASAGGGAFDKSEIISRQWRISRDFLERHVTGVDNLAVITVVGDSMMPDYRPHDKVLVDTGMRYNHDGVYLLYSPFGLIIKQVQYVFGSNPPKFRIISRNEDYPVDIIEGEMLDVRAKVVAKWLWQ